MSSNRPKRNDGQIRLLIPSEWIEELDLLAEAKLKSRLAVIRQYIREKIDSDLIELSSIITKRQEVKRARATSDRWLHERRQRKEDDGW